MNKLDIHEVLKYLPHRYPFLLIDRVSEYTKGEFLVAIKNVSMNEPFFQGHFPHRPVMPGVLVVEAMAQACAILSFKTLDQLPGDHAVYLFVGIDKARFKRTVEPGDQLRIEVSLRRRIQGIWRFTGKATVDGNVVCTAELMCAYKDL